MKLQRAQALLLAVAAVGGYGGAAAVNGLLLPDVSIATSFGPGDSLSRYLLSGQGGDVTPAVLTGLEAVDGVAAVAVSPSVPVFGDVTDPYVSSYSYNGTNTVVLHRHRPLAW